MHSDTIVVPRLICDHAICSESTVFLATGKFGEENSHSAVVTPKMLQPTCFLHYCLTGLHWHALETEAVF